jgi:hypothetical protein
MAAGRSARRRPERSTAYQQSPLSFGEISREVMGEATARWIEASKGTAQEEVSRAFADAAPVVARHWSEVLDRLWRTFSEPRKDGDLLAAQRELQTFFLVQMNEMMKEMMGTKGFAAMAGDSVEAYLKAKIASDRMMEEVLKAMRIPTKTDIEDIHSSIYSLSKKVDQLLGPHAAPARRPARKGRR